MITNHTKNKDDIDDYRGNMHDMVVMILIIIVMMIIVMMIASLHYKNNIYIYIYSILHSCLIITI